LRILNTNLLYKSRKAPVEVDEQNLFPFDSLILIPMHRISLDLWSDETEANDCFLTVKLSRETIHGDPVIFGMRKSLMGT
jgi:hypothetical protein